MFVLFTGRQSPRRRRMVTATSQSLKFFWRVCVVVAWACQQTWPKWILPSMSIRRDWLCTEHSHKVSRNSVQFDFKMVWVYGCAVCNVTKCWLDFSFNMCDTAVLQDTPYFSLICDAKGYNIAHKVTHKAWICTLNWTHIHLKTLMCC